MVNRYAVVIDGTVQNVALVDDAGDWKPPQGAKLVLLDETQPVSPGDTYDGKTFTPTTLETVTTVPVEVDPQALATAKVAVGKASTVATLRSAVLDALGLLTPGE